jgi:hypothetical protein
MQFAPLRPTILGKLSLSERCARFIVQDASAGRNYDARAHAKPRAGLVAKKVRVISQTPSVELGRLCTGAHAWTAAVAALAERDSPAR